MGQLPRAEVLASALIWRPTGAALDQAYQSAQRYQVRLVVVDDDSDDDDCTMMMMMMMVIAMVMSHVHMMYYYMSPRRYQ